MMWHKCSDLSEEIVVTVGEIRTQMFPRWVAYGAGKNSKSLFGKSRGKVGQICTDCLGGGRMVMAKSLFKIV